MTASLLVMAFGLAILFGSNAAFAKTDAIVSVTHFPPFYEVDAEGQVKGLGIDVLDALNELQDKYHFIPLVADAQKRHAMFDQGLYNLSFFDQREWGWDLAQVDQSDIYLISGEVFFAKRSQSTDQYYFKKIKDKSIIGMAGYHYKFADFETDPKKLQKRFDLTLTTEHNQIINAVLEDKVEIGIINEVYLQKYFNENLTARSRIITSNYYDQPYRLRTIIRKNTKPDVQEINQLMNALRQDPVYGWIKEKYGIRW